MNPDNHNDWDATKRAAADLCRELWADPGTGSFLTKIGEMRAAIHRSAEVTRQPWGAVVTVHQDLDRAASGWSERGSDLHRQAQAEAQRAEAATHTAAREAESAVALAARAARGLPVDWRTIEVKPGVRTVIDASWWEFQGSHLDAPGVLIWFDDDTTPYHSTGGEAGEVVREVLDLRHAIPVAG